MDTKTINKPSCNQMEPLLREHPLFARLDDKQLSSICNFSKVIQLAEGDILFNHGDCVHSFYFVYSGLIKIYRQSSSGQEKIFGLEGAGKVFAEALMFADHPHYPVSAAAMQKTMLIAINTKHFKMILSESIDTCMLIMADLSRRMHELINEIDNLSSLSGRNRVATYFLDQIMSKGLEFKLDIPKNAIASMLSLQPETFSRLLKELCTEQAIAVNDCHIQILDKQKLRKLAGILN